MSEDTLPASTDAAIHRSRPLRADLVDLPEDRSREFDTEEIGAFFEKLVEGYKPTEVGLSLGWSPAMIKRFISDPARAEIIDALNEAEIDSWERALSRLCQAGNPVALKYALNNKARHRGYSDTRHVQIDTREQQEIIVSVRAGLDAKTRELVDQHGEAGVRALQQAYLDDDDVIDGEVVE